MAQNTENRGLPSAYQEGRDKQPVRFGAYIGKVKSNVDPARKGRIWVFCEAFQPKLDESNPRKWIEAAYCPMFGGSIAPPSNPAPTTPDNYGTFESNPVSYGMWFPAPDIGTTVLIMFINGDVNRAIYTGTYLDSKKMYMVPAIGASQNYVLAENGSQDVLASAKLLPVTELNPNNKKVRDDPRFFDQPKPVHSVLASQFFKQGLLNDNVRGPITSSSQRESPSTVSGISTPGRPIYQNVTDQGAAVSSETGQIKTNNVAVVGRTGGHSLVLDDGDVSGKNRLIRIRTSSGHQITMSDDGAAIYIAHANGETWIELGAEGTLDVFSSNSINLRTQGQLNLHADRDININSGGVINMKAGAGIAVESLTDISFKTKASFTVWTGFKLGLKADGILTMVSTAGSWDAGKIMALEAKTISLNGGKVDTVQEPENIPVQNLPDVAWSAQNGWTPAPKNLETIVTRAPSHEPYLYHNTGVDNSVEKIRLLGEYGDPAKTVFTGQVFGNDVSVDMRAGFAITQIPETGPAADFAQQLAFTDFAINANTAAAANPGTIDAVLNVSPQQLTQALSNQARSIAGVANTASKVVSDVTTAATTLDSLGRAIIPGSGANSSQVQALANAFANGSLGPVSSVIANTLGVAQKIVNTPAEIAGAVTGAAAGAVGAVQDQITKASAEVQKALSQITNLPSLLGKTVVGMAESAAINAAASALGKFTGVTDALNKIGTEITGAAQGLGNQVLTNLGVGPINLGGLEAGIQGAVSGITETITGAISGFVQGFSSLFGGGGGGVTLFGVDVVGGVPFA